MFGTYTQKSRQIEAVKFSKIIELMQRPETRGIYAGSIKT